MNINYTEMEHTMNTHKKYITLFLTILVLLSCFASCNSNSFSELYDDEARLASKSNTYSLANDQQSTDGTTCTVSAEEFEGMDTLWSYEAKETETIELTCQLTVYSGKLKLILIAPDNSITTITEVTSETKTSGLQTFCITLPAGENRMKVVGDSDTRFELELSVPVGEFLELGF